MSGNSTRKGRESLTVETTKGYSSSAFAVLRHPGSCPGFSIDQIDQMMADEQVRIAMVMASAPMVEVEVEVSGDKRQAEFAKRELEKVWNAHAFQLISGLWWSRCYGEVVYEVRDGMYRVKTILPISPMDAKVLQQKSNGRVLGLRVDLSKSEMAGLYDTEDNCAKIDLLGPKAFVFINGYEERFRSMVGYSDLEPAHRYWYEKNCRDGALDCRLGWHFGSAFDKGDITYPPGETRDEAGNVINNRDWAMRMIEMARSGAAFAFPAQYDEAGNLLWNRTRPAINGSGDSFSAYINDLNVSIARGVGLPDDIIQQNGGTGSYAGRSIPMRAFLGSRALKARSIMMAIDHCAVRHCVKANFGSANYSISNVTLLLAKEFQEAEGGANSAPPPVPFQKGDGTKVPGEEYEEEEFDDEETGEFPFSDGDEGFLELGYREDHARDPKNWAPYKGKMGGEGWMNIRTKQVLYQKERPGRDQLVDMHANGALRTKKLLENRRRAVKSQQEHKKKAGRRPISAKAALAIKSHKPADGEKVAFANMKATKFIKSFEGASVSAGLLAEMDGVIVIGGVEAHLLEIKTLIDNDKNEINVHGPSREKKLAYLQKSQTVGHTIALEGRIDWKDGKNLSQVAEIKKKYGKVPIAYYRRGFQGYTIAAAMPIFSMKELTKVMSMPLEELCLEAIINPLYRKALPASAYQKMTDESETSRVKGGWKVRLRKGIEE
jgi:hypothetical protein